MVSDEGKVNMVCTTTDTLYCRSGVSVVLLVASEADPSIAVVFHKGVSQRGTYCITYCDVSAYVSVLKCTLVRQS